MDSAILSFMIGLVVGCFIGALLIALIVTGHDGGDEIPDDTDRGD